MGQNCMLNYTSLNNNNFILNSKNFILNFGPQHPASHGVLRLVISLVGEVVNDLDPNIGFLHRGTEKLMENHCFNNAAVFVDRLDYTSVLTQTHAYCLAVESGISTPNMSIYTEIIRAIFDELSRLLNHLLSIATHALDIGTMAPLFWAFEDRERIMELFEFVSGARMHTCLYIPNQILDSIITDEFLIKIVSFIKNSNKTFAEIYIALYNNRVWKLRLANVGHLSYMQAILLATSGPVARSSGMRFDLRISNNLTYGFYKNISIRSFIGTHGDGFDRFIIRMREMFESSRLLGTMLCDLYTNTNMRILCTRVYNLSTRIKIESLISLFKFVVGDFIIQSLILHGNIESGKGEFAVLLITNNTNKPYRIYIRSPAYLHLQLLSIVGIGHHIADLATLLGSLDIVFGEVDR